MYVGTQVEFTFSCPNYFVLEPIGSVHHVISSPTSSTHWIYFVFEFAIFSIFDFDEETSDLMPELVGKKY